MEKIITIGKIIYVVILLSVTVRIIYDTQNPAKALSYLLLIVFIPVFGIIFYLSFGINYRKRKFYSKKIPVDDAESKSLPLPVDKMKLLINGEAKFSEVIRVLENAQDHIHIEYYIYADDEIGNRIKEILIAKAREGVKVRFIYDDFASHRVSRRIAKELRAAGAEVYPFREIKRFILLLGNGMNYRNHRKIIVVDSKYGFVGGINVADRYINNGKNKLYWRDTHLMLQGSFVAGLQQVFISDWNFCAHQQVKFSEHYFPAIGEEYMNKLYSLVQMVSSGPDSKNANVMLACMGAISTARKRLYITTPYFIPNETIINSIKLAALKGVDVRLLVPGVSDSWLVNAASCSNYGELMEAGVRIYRYRKGFLHAKTLAVDDNLSVIGTANMDVRSYDLNFEIIALAYDLTLNEELIAAFIDDLKESDEINPKAWKNRSRTVRFGERLARLVSPLL
jgi:cardiolipin synthase